ncbi:hypothetical protein F7725_010997 [Dissostichus mawsoni]|uniref:Uncharacterized protein n=1 Tax=Dissostichus mawsoni TaxID=36200 RepID=A0A7J5Z804_DISMA|nr:hypothetical protein F7725_010997 [Dissostichus mawsoni]
MSGQSSGGCGFLMSVVVHGDSALNDQEKELNQRLRRLYPAVNETETPLPRSWSPKDKFSYIGLSQNNLRVHYKGHGKTPKDAASVRATHPHPCCLRGLLLRGQDHQQRTRWVHGHRPVSSGCNMNRLPGWDKHSYGYHGDDGHSFCSSGTGQPYGPTFTTGDVIGCCVNLINNTCFYTKNGHSLGIAFTDLPTPGEVVDANFGQHPFVFDIEDYMREWRTKIQAQIDRFPIGEREGEWQSMIQKKVIVEHLGSLEIVKVNAASLEKVLCEFFEKNNIPWNNLVSMLMDSCAVMRGSKTGLEIRMHQYCPNLLDIDGDSCHHIHNAAKKFSEPFDSYLEKLFSDLQVDHQWSPDQVMYLKEIAMILNLPASSPQRGFVPHRWLSAYDASMATYAMMPAYRVLYYGFLSTADKELYREPLELMYTKYHVNQAGRARIKVVQEELNRKGMTPQGRERKKRVCQKLWHEETTTVLRLSIYMGLLAILKEYVMVFQGSQTLVHKLHDRQLELFLAFMACFVKAEHITQLSPSALREMVLEDHMLLPSKEVYVGQEADTFRSQNPNHALLVPFLADVRKAYITTAVYLQKKLPLASPTLTALSALDPLLRGHSQATIQLKRLSGMLRHLLPADQDIQRELVRFNVDLTIPSFKEGESIVEWWPDKYPSLSAMVKCCLSIFHGPRVESSFSLMNEVIDQRSGNMNVPTFNAIQTGKTAVQLFRREDVKFGEVDRTLCKNINSAAATYKRQQKMNQKEKQQQQSKYGSQASGSAQQAKKQTAEEEKRARLRHVAKQRKRAMETLERVFQLMVASYLVHHSYCATAEAFAKSTDQAVHEELASIKNRQKIQKLVLSGRMGEAIETTTQLYPTLLERNPDLLFMLKVRQFIEMVNGTDSEVRCLGGRSPKSQDIYPASPRPFSPSHKASGSLPGSDSTCCNGVTSNKSHSTPPHSHKPCPPASPPPPSDVSLNGSHSQTPLTSSDVDMEVDHVSNGVTESSSNGFLNGSKHVTEPDECEADMAPVALFVSGLSLTFQALYTLKQTHNLPKQPPLAQAVGQAAQCLSIMARTGTGSCAFASGSYAGNNYASEHFKVFKIMENKLKLKDFWIFHFTYCEVDPVQEPCDDLRPPFLLVKSPAVQQGICCLWIHLFFSFSALAFSLQAEHRHEGLDTEKI